MNKNMFTDIDLTVSQKKKEIQALDSERNRLQMSIENLRREQKEAIEALNESNVQLKAVRRRIEKEEEVIKKRLSGIAEKESEWRTKIGEAEESQKKLNVLIEQAESRHKYLNEIEAKNKADKKNLDSDRAALDTDKEKVKKDIVAIEKIKDDLAKQEKVAKQINHGFEHKEAELQEWEDDLDKKAEGNLRKENNLFSSEESLRAQWRVFNADKNKLEEDKAVIAKQKAENEALAEKLKHESLLQDARAESQNKLDRELKARKAKVESLEEALSQKL